jgi:hypothetical protein
MRFTPSPTEATTAATDAVLAAVCLALLLRLARDAGGPRWKKQIWGAVFTVLAAGSVLGAIAHGVDWTPATRERLWQPLYLTLGLTVALFGVGALGDWRGERAARTALPWAVAAAAGFFAATQLSPRGFDLFIAYEAVVMSLALAIYARLWLVRQARGATRVAGGIVLTLLAAAIQQTAWTVRLYWPFDHNGLFHLVQMAAMFVIASGIHADLQASATDAGRAPAGTV